MMQECEATWHGCGVAAAAHPDSYSTNKERVLLVALERGGVLRPYGKSFVLAVELQDNLAEVHRRSSCVHHALQTLQGSAAWLSLLFIFGAGGWGRAVGK
jgi:hypothetical protein